MTPLTTSEQVNKLKKGAKITKVLTLNGRELTSTYTVDSNRMGNLKMTNNINNVQSVGINLEYAKAKWFVG